MYKPITVYSWSCYIIPYFISLTLDPPNYVHPYGFDIIFQLL